MYEPIRSKSVHTSADNADFPHRSREDELDIQLAGHLAALLAVTDELGLTALGERIAQQVARLRSAPPARHAGRSEASPAALHRRAHALMRPGPGGGGVPRRHRRRDPGGRGHGHARRGPGRPHRAHRPGRRALTAPVHGSRRRVDRVPHTCGDAAAWDVGVRGRTPSRPPHLTRKL